MNVPRPACTYCSVVVHALFPRGPFGISFGKLTVPFLNDSTCICQSLSSIVSKTIRRLKSVLHGMDTTMRLAVKKGVLSGAKPSIIKSSKM